MKCIQHECPYFFKSDIFKTCIPFQKYIINKDTACTIEDFHNLKEKYACEIATITKNMDHLDYVLNLIQSRQ